ncbi:b(o/a)3-type cytochrome-c oxidase subunit 1 [Brevibacillus fulvus]|uniref:Cytochrome c oxidase subunit 1 n=1 Tax=Brevibacillus fulvus TaxID=1125967 RepID=A0A939BT29_9BACL|nr:b(o/a)3-type cytochrome-c oxidase subunit 1 [Brevibacillus fulvus]MBM7591377.1 cytochrome c oxidase subunit 1 [Brevibacillus fulvus]
MLAKSKDNRLAFAFIATAFLFFFIGTICGLLQGLVRGGVIKQLPYWLDYYKVLTTHGVSLALLFTTNFIYGFFFAGVHKTMGNLSAKVRAAGWGGFWLMIIGTIMAVVTVLAGDASVLYTFYAPLKASPFFYIGLALWVIGSWVSGIAMMAHYFQWKKQHPQETTPLFGYMVVGTNLLWITACLGVAATVVLQMIPWSLGMTDKINILLSRTLFWYFGHPLVYFWLLPAYAYWYVSIPKLIGGKIFSDSLARLSFILFLIFSIPVGFHHQLMEPGIGEGWKFIQVSLTLMVVIPSLMTAFSMFASFESAGRRKGATGLFGWWKKLPYGDVRFLSPFLGMLFFIPAGIGGIINTSYQLDEIVHNTLWVVGHFHITVGAAVVMSFFGITYWLVPHLTGRTFSKSMNRLGILQVVLWAVGMFIMSTAMHVLGLYGAPRRTAYSTYGNDPVALDWFHGLVANQLYLPIGAFLLFLSSMLMVYLFIHLAFLAPKATADERVDFPISEAEHPEEKPPVILDKWKLWVGICVVLILLAYSVPVMDMLHHSPASPGYRTW